ncbi:MAG TPA: acetyl-CoA hydrolase/transferase C-terminal domain-containing protein [Burkholderiaceae bacterium]|nr:acetyl-CoA hydrolase/transferase C-terminal domain-containing protein [Burkholderiaceae bacterium]HMY99312.1 acetyl-CoA hydrolase/transferase C-terminal domain-containing protein [Burkholderiaceae bacterium]HNG79923.1 acetyl-CoA hydrolase/transferase C-terminal domain-containing protein [Burkholderiaceae bacterium]
MNFQQQYASKLAQSDDVIRLVRDGDTVVVPTAAAEAPKLLEALSEHRRDFQDVKVSQILPIRKHGYFDPGTISHVRHQAYFFGPASRGGGQAGWIDYSASNFSEMPEMIRRGLKPADVVFASVSPMDTHGYFSLGLAADYTMAAISKARVVALEVNPNVPFTNGDCMVHISQVTALVENDEPVIEVGLPKIGAVQEAIGKYVADMIPDGATLQIGYGAIPDAVVMQLTHKRDLGIHTEMLGDGILTLIEAGVVTNQRKNVNRGKILATFALGSRKLYDFMHRNPAVELHPSDITNDPWLAGQNQNLIAINATMQIDLAGQCGSETLGWTPVSGTGGQTDFVRAANRSEGGKAFIVLPSTAKDDSISRIVPTLTPGAHVSTSKNDINYVVTEFGVAQLRGKTARQRAEALIAISHPNFRAELREEAKRMNLL